MYSYLNPWLSSQTGCCLLSSGRIEIPISLIFFLVFPSQKHQIDKNRRSSILGLQSISWDVADNVSHPRRLDTTMEQIAHSFVLYLQHGHHYVKCNPSIGFFTQVWASVLNTSSHYPGDIQNNADLPTFQKKNVWPT